nr:hypothetical protein [uncultured Allomuricauda sp.]
MELEKFIEIRELFCLRHPNVTEGKMMSSPAIHYNKKVFAFFSRKQKMVFKLGKEYPFNELKAEASEFNPFKNKKPLTGWYEVDFDHQEKWEMLTNIALEKIKKQ